MNVLIVGAGPVGLTMAAELARYGVSVRIVETAAQRTDKSKALSVWSRTLELLERAGCADTFLSTGRRVSSARIIAGNEVIGRISLDHVATRYPFALMIPQSETERLLEDHLTSLGVQVERNVSLSTFEDRGDRVVSILKHSDGRKETLESSWIIGCDGAHSTVRHTLGLEFHGDTLVSDWILGDLTLKGQKRPTDIEIHWHADGILAIFPITAERFRVIADAGVASGAAARPDPTLGDIQTVLDGRGLGGLQASSPNWLASFRINERKVKRYRVRRAFIAGDAAHIHSPAGGQGMNTGMQDAFNLAWKLALVCKGNTNADTLLDSYSAERSAVGDEVLKVTGITTAIAMLRGPLKQSIRNHVASFAFGLSAVRKKAADVLTEVSVGYPHSPLNGKGTLAGQRALIRDGEAPVGAGRAPRFALFAEFSDDAKSIMTDFSELLESGPRNPLPDGKFCLVRPDGYIAVCSDDAIDVRNFLDRIANLKT